MLKNLTDISLGGVVSNFVFWEEVSWLQVWKKPKISIFIINYEMNRVADLLFLVKCIFHSPLSFENERVTSELYY